MLRVASEGKEWRLRKRFSEFDDLHKVIGARYPGVPDLPSKTLFRQFDPQHLHERAQALGRYLESMRRRRDVMNCSELWDFLQLPVNLPSFREEQQLQSSAPRQVAEVQEASFGVRDFRYSLEQGVLLVGATDFSLASRLDTMITNVRLPWEPKAAGLPMSQLSLWRQEGSTFRFEVMWAVRYTFSAVQPWLDERLGLPVPASNFWQPGSMTRPESMAPQRETGNRNPQNIVSRMWCPMTRTRLPSEGPVAG